jgi:hypothetical protein
LVVECVLVWESVGERERDFVRDSDNEGEPLSERVMLGVSVEDDDEEREADTEEVHDAESLRLLEIVADGEKVGLEVSERLGE